MAITTFKSYLLIKKNLKRFGGKLISRSLLLFPLILAFGCAHIDDSDSNQQLASRDTTLEICGVKHENIPIELTPWALEDFLSFSTQYCQDFPSYEQTLFVDTTGNGTSEKVTTFVSFTSNNINIQNTIHNQAGRLLWKDKIVLDKKSASRIFGDKEVFEKFYPLSALYAGITSAAFMDSLDKENSKYDLRKKQLLRHISGVQNIEDLQTLYESELSKFIESYEGKYLFTLDQNKRKIYMWNEEKNAFVPLTVS